MRCTIYITIKLFQIKVNGSIYKDIMPFLNLWVCRDGFFYRDFEWQCCWTAWLYQRSMYMQCLVFFSSAALNSSSVENRDANIRDFGRSILSSCSFHILSVWLYILKTLWLAWCLSGNDGWFFCASCYNIDDNSPAMKQRLSEQMAEWPSIVTSKSHSMISVLPANLISVL